MPRDAAVPPAACVACSLVPSWLSTAHRHSPEVMCGRHRCSMASATARTLLSVASASAGAAAPVPGRSGLAAVITIHPLAAADGAPQRRRWVRAVVEQVADDVAEVLRERHGGLVLPSRWPGAVCCRAAAFAQVAFPFQDRGDGGDAGVSAGGVVDAVLDF